MSVDNQVNGFGPAASRAVSSRDGRLGGEAAELVVVEEQVDAGDPAVLLLAGDDEGRATVELDDERSYPVDRHLSEGGHLAAAGEVDPGQ